jgi:uroporphyrinogen decarboxylase
MNGYERIMTALKGEQPDRVPTFELLINAPVIEALHPDLTVAKEKNTGTSDMTGGSQEGFQSLATFIEREDIDAILLFEEFRPKKWFGSEHYVDEWNIVWKAASPGLHPYVVEHPIKNERDLDAYTPPDPDADYRMNTLRQAVRRFKGEKAIVFLSNESFFFSFFLRGMNNLLMDYILNPAFAKRLARMVIDNKKRIFERAIEAGADVLMTGDDYAYKNAPIMSPDCFKEFILPYLQENVDIARKNNIPIIKHTDGNIWSILDMIVDTGIDALNPIEPQAHMDIARVKEMYGDSIALMGNIDCGELLCRGRPEEVVEAVKETIAKASPGGGHILASSNSIHPAVNPLNYRTMLEACKRYGQYPLDEKMVESYKIKDYYAQYRGETVDKS